MSRLISKSTLLTPQIILSGNDVIHPKEGLVYLQQGSQCNCIILPSSFQPLHNCSFIVKTSKGGLYLINNSNVVYKGNKFLVPYKICRFFLSHDISSNTWTLSCEDGSLIDTNIVLDWTISFNQKVTGAPPLAARKFAHFINGVYNALIQYSLLFDQAVVNEAANQLWLSIIPTTSPSSVYDKYPKLESESDKTSLQSFIASYLSDKTIPSAATNPAYSLPPSAQTKWYGTNPVLPNWNPTNIGYLANSYTQETKEPFTTMEAEAKELKELKLSNATNEIALHFANTAPPRHMIEIACSLIANTSLSALSYAKLLSLLGIALSDAGLYAWNAKYAYWGARPFQYIPSFVPFITTPNFPGYISGHSTFSGSWAQMLSMLLPTHSNMVNYIADLSGISRLYGGIHFQSDNVIGLASGRAIGKSVYTNLITKIKNGTSFL
jgi:hypothetical protein